MRHRRLTSSGPILLLFALGMGLATGCGGDNAPPPERTADRVAASAPEEHQPPAPGSRGRVVVLGTSLTAGMGLDDPGAESWAGQLQFLADSSGIQVEVVNAGVSGDTSAGGLRRLDWLLRERVDVLVVELGANDGLRGQDLAALEANLTSIVQDTRSRYPEARVAVLAMEAPPNLGADYVQGFRDVFPRVAEANDAVYVPFVLDGVAGVPALNQPDGIHPTAEGHARMARAAWPYLESIFRAAEVDL